MSNSSFLINNYAPVGGIIPYVKLPDGEIYFLLGYEKSIKKWYTP